MKKYFNITCILFLSLLLISCEKSEVVEVETEGTTKIIIQAEVVSGAEFSGVSVTSSLPVGTVYDISQAEIKDAYIYLLINGVKIVPLHYKSKSIYLPKDTLQVKPGDIYELFAKVRGSDIYSKTYVPFKPEASEGKYNKDGFIETNVTAKSGEAYGALWAIQDGSRAKATDFYDIYEGDTFTYLNVRTDYMDENYRTPDYAGVRKCQVIAYDRIFIDYFKTKAQNVPGNNEVTVGGMGVAWNVQGKNAIGLFIGIAYGGMLNVY